MTAIRETFEETGLLLASVTSESGELPLPVLSQSSPPSLSEVALDASRESIHTGRTLFRDFLKQHALSADVKALLPFTEWITPLGYSRCVPLLSLSHTLSHTHTLTHLNNQTCQQLLHTTPQLQSLPHAFLRLFPALPPHVRLQLRVLIFFRRDRALAPTPPSNS